MATVAASACSCCGCGRGAGLVATHNPAMECSRRFMLKEQSFEGRRQNLEFANKLVRSYAALDQHRGKRQP